MRTIFSTVILSLLTLSFSLQSETKTPGTKWNAELYNKHATVQEARTRAFFESYTFRGDEDLLDLGSGDGRITARIAGLVPKGYVIGLDVSKDMVDFAKKTFEGSEHPNLSFVRASASEFNLNKKFDLIVSFNTLHWVPDQDGVVKQARNHLKKGGKIYFLFSTKYERTPYVQAMNKIAASPKWKKLFKGYKFAILSHGVDAYVDRLINNNFKIDKITFKSADSTFASEAEFFNWQRSGMPEMQRIPKELHDAFLADFRDEFVKLGTKDEQGLIHWPHYLVEVTATSQT